MRRSSLLLLTALAACAAPQPRQAAPAPATPIAPQTANSCVELSRIQEARVISDRQIDFHMRDGTVLRNDLPNTCPGLGFEKAFTYATSLSRLCSVDIITVIHQGGGPRTGASCGLGKFTPAAAPATAAR